MRRLEVREFKGHKVLKREARPPLVGRGRGRAPCLTSSSRVLSTSGRCPSGKDLPRGPWTPHKGTAFVTRPLWGLSVVSGWPPKKQTRLACGVALGGCAREPLKGAGGGADWAKGQVDIRGGGPQPISRGLWSRGACSCPSQVSGLGL